MPSDTCPYCGHDKKKYFAQIISNGKKVVAQRCANCLRSWKGQPFVPVLGFDWNSLPRWDDSQAPAQEDQPAKERDVQQEAYYAFFPNERPQKRPVKGQVGYVPPELPR